MAITILVKWFLNDLDRYSHLIFLSLHYFHVADSLVCALGKHSFQAN